MEDATELQKENERLQARVSYLTELTGALYKDAMQAGGAAQNTASHIAMTEAQPTRLEAHLIAELDRLRAVEAAARKLIAAIDRGVGFAFEPDFWDAEVKLNDALGLPKE